MYSAQWLDLDLPVHPLPSAPELLERYLSHIRRTTFSVVRPAVTPDGIEFRLGTTQVLLLSFQPAERLETDTEDRVILRISGGRVVQSGLEGGEFSLGVVRRAQGVRIQSELSGYHPYLLGSPPPTVLRRLRYRYTQGAIHRWIALGFLKNICGELAGSKPS